MPTKILKDQIEVGNRLETLNFTREELLEVADAMIGAKAECTDNDPPGARGWLSYRWGTRRLREVKLTQEDWEKDDTDQIASILNKKLSIRVAVSNTDDGTGIDDPDRYPQNRSKKGGATDRAVHVNQLSFMEALDASVKVVALRAEDRPSGPVITWYLCVYSEGDVFRAELSCPVGIDGGFFTGFVERIFLIGADDDSGEPLRRRTDDGPDHSEFDIPVTRK
jgi:hypothetical protein